MYICLNLHFCIHFSFLLSILDKARPHSLVLFLPRWQVNFVMRFDSLGRREISGARARLLWLIELFVTVSTCLDTCRPFFIYFSSPLTSLPLQLTVVFFLRMRSTCRSTKTQSSESEKVIRRWVIWDFSKPQVIQSLSAWQLWLCWLCISKQRERLGVYRFQRHSSTDPPTSIFIFRMRSGSASFWRVFSAPRTRDSVLAEEVDRSRFVTCQQFDRFL